MVPLMVEDILATLANPRVPTERDATARARAPGSEREKDLAGEDCAGPTAAAGGLRIPSRTPSGGPARRITPLPPPNGPNKAEAGLSFFRSRRPTAGSGQVHCLSARTLLDRAVSQGSALIPLHPRGNSAGQAYGLARDARAHASHPAYHADLARSCRPH